MHRILQNYHDICNINSFKKYFFLLIASVYTMSVLGVPVYFHYCEGELENVDFITKGSGCCCDDDEESGEKNNCCKDETLLLQNDKNALVKSYERVIKQSSFLLFAVLPHFSNHFCIIDKSEKTFQNTFTSKLDQQRLISTFILRI